MKTLLEFRPDRPLCNIQNYLLHTRNKSLQGKLVYASFPNILNSQRNSNMRVKCLTRSLWKWISTQTWKIVRVVKHYSNVSTEELLKEFRRSYGGKKINKKLLNIKPFIYFSPQNLTLTCKFVESPRLFCAVLIIWNPKNPRLM